MKGIWTGIFVFVGGCGILETVTFVEVDEREQVAWREQAVNARRELGGSQVVVDQGVRVPGRNDCRGYSVKGVSADKVITAYARDMGYDVVRGSVEQFPDLYLEFECVRPAKFLGYLSEVLERYGISLWVTDGVLAVGLDGAGLDEGQVVRAVQFDGAGADLAVIGGHLGVEVSELGNGVLIVSGSDRSVSSFVEIVQDAERLRSSAWKFFPVNLEISGVLQSADASGVSFTPVAGGVVVFAESGSALRRVEAVLEGLASAEIGCRRFVFDSLRRSSGLFVDLISGITVGCRDPWIDVETGRVVVWVDPSNWTRLLELVAVYDERSRGYRVVVGQLNVTSGRAVNVSLGVGDGVRLGLDALVNGSILDDFVGAGAVQVVSNSGWSWVEVSAVAFEGRSAEVSDTVSVRTGESVSSADGLARSQDVFEDFGVELSVDVSGYGEGAQVGLEWSSSNSQSRARLLVSEIVDIGLGEAVVVYDGRVIGRGNSLLGGSSSSRVRSVVFVALFKAEKANFGSVVQSVRELVGDVRE